MNQPIQFPGEQRSNNDRKVVADKEGKSLRTFTPTQAVLAKSSGVYHWTPEGRRLYDYTSGVLVANLGHNPQRWLARFADYMGWKPDYLKAVPGTGDSFVEAMCLTSYNAVTELETAAVQRLLASVRATPEGRRLDTVLWAASGSEAIQKALWACLHRDESRDIILATRHGFHGKKGLAGAVTGSETDHDRDPRVKFISFPMHQVDDLSRRTEPLDLEPYHRELQQLQRDYGGRINCLITEPYLGGGGSYHPPAAYLQLLDTFCHEHDIMLVLDEVQSNFGRTGQMYAFESYSIQPDLVCLGKGMGNGIPVSAVVGRRDVIESLDYGEASDTWSGNPLSCAAVLATLDEFETRNVLEHARSISTMFEQGLSRLKQTGVVAKVRGEGMVFGVECSECGPLTSGQVANALVEACYLGKPNRDGIHILGPLAGNVLRVSPPLVITKAEAERSLDLFHQITQDLCTRLDTRSK